MDKNTSEIHDERCENSANHDDLCRPCYTEWLEWLEWIELCDG